MESSIELKKTVLACLLCALMALVLVACHHQPALNFTGTYVNHAESEFSVADDTLVIEGGRDKGFVVHRKTGFHVTDEQGVPGKRRYEREEWQAVYDGNKKVLRETKKGLVLALVKDGLLLENSRYRRIN